MAQKLAFPSCNRAALITQLVDLADIVQHHAAEQQIESIMGNATPPAPPSGRAIARARSTRPDRRDDLLGGRGRLVAAVFRIGQERFEQRRKCVSIMPAMIRALGSISSGSRSEAGK